MKQLLFVLLCLPFVAFGQNGGKNLQFICNVLDVPAKDSLVLFEYVGLTARPLQRAAVQPGTTSYTFSVPMGTPRFYAVGVNESSVARVILGEEPEVKLWANAMFMNKARTLGSTANAAYEYMVKRTTALRDGAARNAALTKAKGAYLDSLRAVQPFLWRSATLLLPPHFEGPLGASEAEFYGKSWFRYANLAKDRGYDDVPDVFFSFNEYLKTLVSLRATEAQTRQWADEQLAKIPADSKTYRLALGGLINGAREAQAGPLQVYFAQKYLAKYRNQGYGEIARLEFEIAKASTSTPGMEAPNLEGMTPDSSTYSMRQLRGQVVLVDFWASWCGPCRRENPNVKAMYQKYHDRGFEVLGVSLDRDHAAWVKAINDDGLTWKHISDLKGWQSGHAALYSVSSIPQTLLLDREGRIIERNLRGEALGAKLRDIFGD
jgi:thiol-disulfide isomerase/thioredoxin